MLLLTGLEMRPPLAIYRTLLWTLFCKSEYRFLHNFHVTRSI